MERWKPQLSTETRKYNGSPNHPQKQGNVAPLSRYGVLSFERGQGGRPNHPQKHSNTTPLSNYYGLSFEWGQDGSPNYPQKHLNTILLSNYLVLSFERGQDGCPNSQPIKHSLEVDAQTFLLDLFAALWDWLLCCWLVKLLHLLLRLGNSVVGLVCLLPFAVHTKGDNLAFSFSTGVIVMCDAHEWVNE